jgi:hypothetical protein
MKYNVILAAVLAISGMSGVAQAQQAGDPASPDVVEAGFRLGTCGGVAGSSNGCQSSVIATDGSILLKDDSGTDSEDFSYTGLSFQGFFGEDGADGEMGPQGPQGDRGPQGEMGPQGPQGDRGPKGDRGPQGEMGPQGPQGEQGIAGVSADPAELDELRDRIEQVNDEDQRLVEGTYDADSETLTLFTQDMRAGDDGDISRREVVVNLAGVNGTDGVDGQDGAQGIQGERGEQGIQGERGEQGPQGEQGIQGERGEQGIAGRIGPIGPQGPQGERGQRGTILDVDAINTESELSDDNVLTQETSITYSLDGRSSTTTNTTETDLSRLDQSEEVSQLTEEVVQIDNRVTNNETILGDMIQTQEEQIEIANLRSENSNARMNLMQDDIDLNTQRIGRLENDMSHLRNDMYSGLAGVAAMGAIPYALQGQTAVGIGYGNFGGQDAAALGISKRSDNGKHAFTFSGTFTEQQNGVAAGYSFSFGGK